MAYKGSKWKIFGLVFVNWRKVVGSTNEQVSKEYSYGDNGQIKQRNQSSGLGVTSPSPWSLHPSWNENLHFGFQARVVTQEEYINFVSSHPFLLGISTGVFCCLLFQRHLYANTFYANYFHVCPSGYAPHHPPGRIISHEKLSNLILKIYSEKFKPRFFFPTQEIICSGEPANSQKMDWANIRVLILPQSSWERRPGTQSI